MSIMRVGLAETQKFAEGWEAIFGKKRSAGAKKQKAEKPAARKPVAKKPAAKSAAKKKGKSPRKK